jgi:hypothetical protein
MGANPKCKSSGRCQLTISSLPPLPRIPSKTLPPTSPLVHFAAEMQQPAERMDPRLARLILHLVFRRPLRRWDGPEATLPRLICRLPLHALRFFLPAADAASQPRARVAHEGRFRLDLAPPPTTFTAPATVSDLLLLVAIRRYFHLLTPRAAVLEGLWTVGIQQYFL